MLQHGIPVVHGVGWLDLWLFVAGLILAVRVLWIRPSRRSLTTPGPWCERCGYSLHGRPNASSCPECGHPETALTVAMRLGLTWRLLAGARFVRRTAWLVATLLIVGAATRAMPIKENAGYTIHLDRSPQRVAQLWNDDVDVANQAFMGSRPGEQWILPHWRFRHHLPGTLRYEDIKLRISDVPQDAQELVLTVEEGTGRYRYTTPDGVEHVGDQLDEGAMLAWMEAAGASVDAVYVREEAAHAAMLIDRLARGLPQPISHPNDPLHTWHHGGVRYHIGYRPIPVIVVMAVCWLVLLVWGLRQV
ncbi:MAG: hypothetical protein WD534_00425 [Phycisphaeraceae bacterium]